MKRRWDYRDVGDGAADVARVQRQRGQGLVHVALCCCVCAARACSSERVAAALLREERGRGESAQRFVCEAWELPGSV
jgi:hypothetical protein